jgi:hypothetical protein
VFVTPYFISPSFSVNSAEVLLMAVMDWTDEPARPAAAPGLDFPFEPAAAFWA